MLAVSCSATNVDRLKRMSSLRLREAHFPYIEDKEDVAMAGGETLGSKVNHVQRVALSGEMGGGVWKVKGAASLAPKERHGQSLTKSSIVSCMAYREDPVSSRSFFSTPTV